MDVFNDKSWVKRKRIDNEYQACLDAFLDHAFATCSFDDTIACPCSICGNRFYHKRQTVRNHMIMREMDSDYQKCYWNFHGEPTLDDYDVEFADVEEDMIEADFSDEDHGSFEHDMGGMIRDAFEPHRPNNNSSGPNDEAKEFFKLVEEEGQPLYPDCEGFTKLSFVVEMYHLKCLYGVSDGAFDELLKLFKRALPKDSTLPNSFHQTRTIIKRFGLDYNKIDACPNDCVLFWKDKINLDRCPECNASRYKTEDDGTITRLASGDPIPVKVLRHFPLIPRLKRLFMSSKTAPLMRWHEEGRTKDGKLRHPADSEAWKDFDAKYPNFASDPRNVRLCLASDGFNPFGIMGTQYSIWPVVLMAYNLPPWLCMKQPYLMLSLLIPGPKGPGNDIDVYLEPLIDELQELWKSGVETYDASKDETCVIRGALLTTINDFPAYGNLSGWKTKGRYACPHCNVDTCSLYLKRSRKMSYMGHRRFLPGDHKFRRSKKAFNGEHEMKPAPELRSGDELLEQMEGLDVTFGKHRDTLQKNKRSIGDKTMPWKKRSIFFQLEYWKHLRVRHNIDVMHVEKNVSESVVGTLLGIDGKTKDTLQSRLDLKDMNIRHNLHPVDHGSKTYVPPACYTLSKKEKEEFISILASVKVPDGYASNIRRRIVDGKIYGLKSHDHHIIMQQLLPLVARKMQNKELGAVLIDLSNFFKDLCSKVATTEDFENLQDRGFLLLCRLEAIFPPSFFDIMVHLMVHLPYEAKVAGPVMYRWMYPVERDLKWFKGWVGNKSRPEASIAERYIAQECLTYCARYLHGVETRETRCSRKREDGGYAYDGLSVFSLSYRPLSALKDKQPDYTVIDQAHSYVLFNCEEVEAYTQEHYELVSSEFPSVDETLYDIHKTRFPKWFSENVSRHLPSDDKIAIDLKYLSRFPEMSVKTMTKISCNGYNWRIKEVDKGGVNQNSGVLVNTITEEGELACYGVLTEIVELSYPLGRKVVLFRCDWVDPIKGVKTDEYKFTLVNLKSRWATDEPFILASQAIQVFYVPESKEKNWHVAIATKPRDLFEMDADVIPEVDPVEGIDSDVLCEDEMNYVRDDIEGLTLDEPFADLIHGNDDVDIEPDYSTESDDEDDTLYDYGSD